MIGLVNLLKEELQLCRQTDTHHRYLAEMLTFTVKNKGDKTLRRNKEIIAGPF